MIQKNLKQLQAESDKRESKLYMNMFAHMTRDTPVATKVSDVSLILLAYNDLKLENIMQVVACVWKYLSSGSKKLRWQIDTFDDGACFSVVNGYA